MNRSFVAVAAGLVLLVTSSCTYHRARISYENHPEQIPIREAEWEGELLGHVASNEGGAIWNNCTKSAETSLWAVIDDAKRMGGNAIGNIRWIPKKEKGNTERPTCRKGWGWLALWPVTLTTVFMSSRVEADVYRVADDQAVESGFYRIPEDTEERAGLIDLILAHRQVPPRRS